MASMERMANSLGRLTSWLSPGAQELGADVAENISAKRHPPPPLSHEEAVRLESQGLFVVGCARSGTTILARALNHSPEVMLLEEPNFSFNQHIEDFTAFFNGLHRSMGNARMKGTYVRPPVAPESGPLALLLRLAQEHRLVGEKVAIGPHHYGANWENVFLEFHARYFYRSPHLLILRSPAETIWSMQKMFPDRQLDALFSTWLRAISLSIDVYRVLHDARIVFFEDISAEWYSRIGKLLDLELQIPESMLGGSYVRSRLSHGELPPALQPRADLCSACGDIYAELRKNVCREEFLYCGARTEWDFFDDMLGRIAKLLQQLAPPDAKHAEAPEAD